MFVLVAVTIGSSGWLHLASQLGDTEHSAPGPEAESSLQKPAASTASPVLQSSAATDHRNFD